jgi:aspartyl-tRNA(Asn)/glutamyl-tRNA(Gln) amidotransferase subunit C
MNNQPAEGGGTDTIDVAYVAHLARLQLSPEEIRTLQGQLDQILHYVRQLNRLNLDGIEPTAHAIPVQNVLRADEARPGLDRETALANAPARQAGQFAVPPIIE